MSNIVDFFDFLYFKYRIQQGLRYSIIRYSIRKISNAIIPVYFKLTRHNKEYALSQNDSQDFIVSLTSFPVRINDLWKVIESLLRQTVKPSRILLWLSKDQFPNESDIPKSLRRLGKRGLEIIMVDSDLRSHKKYFYTISRFPNKDFVIVDDDVFYNTKTLERLVQCHKVFPDCVCCNLADIILDNEGKILPYKVWKTITAKRNDPQSCILPIGVGGVYYPSGSLNELAKDSSTFMELCPKADDIWLWAMASIEGSKFVNTENVFGYLPVIIKNNITLASTNTTQGQMNGNDAQFRKMVQFLNSSKLANYLFSY